MQKPFYDVNASREANLGGIGYIIAHEITHAFDNNGAKYDENGNAANWWTEQDYEKFQSLCQRVIDFYDGQEIAPGIFCDGELTLSENIADLGAVACITQIESQNKNPDYKTLYTSASKIWCSSYTREIRISLSQNDVHAPDKLRGGWIFATTVNPLTIDKDKNSVLKEIDELIKLKANWDGYGAIPILEGSIHNAKSIVLDESINVSNIEDVQPNPNGTVSIVWSNGMNQVCLEVGTEKMSFFADINGKTSYSNIEKITNENTLKLAAYVNQL